MHCIRPVVQYIQYQILPFGDFFCLLELVVIVLRPSSGEMRTLRELRHDLDVSISRRTKLYYKSCEGP